MACSLRSWSSLRSHHRTLIKVGRLCSTERAVNEGARDPAVEKNDPDAPKTQPRIKNELSYRLPTVSLPPKLSDSVKEVLKRERSIRVVEYSSVQNSMGFSYPNKFTYLNRALFC